MACPLAAERVWVEKSRYHDAEREYYERLAKLLKGSVSETAVENLPPLNVNATADKTKKKPKKAVRKSQSPEAMMDSTEPIAQKSTPNTVVAKAKKNKKPKVESDVSTANIISVPTDSVATKTQEPPSPAAEAVEETKTKKKKKKKTNKDAADKLHDGQKENVPPSQSSAETKAVSQNSHEHFKNSKNKGPSSNQCTLVSEIAKARQHIKNSLEKMDGIATLAASPASPDVLDRLAAVEKDNADLRKLIEGLKNVCLQAENRVKSLEQKLAAVNLGVGAASTPAATPAQDKVDDDDGVDLFASDSEDDDAEAAKIREERLAAYAAKKSKKPALIAKSSLVLDVKPWDDETDMKLLEAEVRKITSDGLLWGASKNVPVAFGIQKLSISCVVEDDKVSIDWLTEEIEKIEDYVQSVDVAAFNKI